MCSTTVTSLRCDGLGLVTSGAQQLEQQVRKVAWQPQSSVKQLRLVARPWYCRSRSWAFPSEYKSRDTRTNFQPFLPPGGESDRVRGKVEKKLEHAGGSSYLLQEFTQNFPPPEGVNPDAFSWCQHPGRNPERNGAVGGEESAGEEHVHHHSRDQWPKRDYPSMQQLIRANSASNSYRKKHFSILYNGEFLTGLVN